MLKLKLLFLSCTFIFTNLHAQNVGIGTNSPNASAALDITSANKGILIPRMAASQRLLITPVDGLIVYDTDSSSLFIYEQIAWKRLRAIPNLQTLITGVSPDDVLVWNGSNWVVTSKCSLFSYYFRDADGDGKGDKYRPVYGCSILPGFVADSTDCDDTNPAIYSGATEICNGIDDDCDGIIDDGCVSVILSGIGSGIVSSTPPGINCPGDCIEPFAVGNNVTLTAAPGVGSVFAGWSGGGCSGTGTCVLTTPNAATTITATFNLQQFTLTTALAGSGTGTITSSPAGINCGVDCNETYNYGTMVTLTANADINSTFLGWSGACSGTGPCVVTMDAAKSVTANFGIQQHTLTITKAGNGSGTVTSSPSGINCGGDCNETYNYGTMVTLTASPAVGSTFAGWSGAGCSGTGTCVVTIDAAKSVTATFILQQFTVTVNKSGAGSGTVTSSPSGISCGTDCSELYNYGTVVNLFPAAAGGSTFAGWSGGGCSGTGSCVITVTAATSVNATFMLNLYTLTINKTGTGTGTVTSTPSGINCGTDCSETYAHGTMVTLTANPSGGNSFAGWSGGGCSGTGSCVVTMTSANTVTATFSFPEPEPEPLPIASYWKMDYKKEESTLSVSGTVLRPINNTQNKTISP